MGFGGRGGPSKANSSERMHLRQQPWFEELCKVGNSKIGERIPAGPIPDDAFSQSLWSYAIGSMRWGSSKEDTLATSEDLGIVQGNIGVPM